MNALIGLFTPIAPSFSAAVTDLAFFVCLMFAIVFCFALGPNSAQNEGRKRCFLLFIGLISGCIAAVLAVPFDPVDSALYLPIGTALGLLFTGYIATKVGPVVKIALKPSDATPVNWTNVGYLSFFLIGAALSATLIVVNRTEWIAQAVRCDPDFYARSLPNELRRNMPRDQKTCERLNIGASKKSEMLPIPGYTSLNIFPYSMAHIRSLPWLTLKSEQCVYNLKFIGTSVLWLECETAYTDATSPSSVKTTQSSSSERSR